MSFSIMSMETNRSQIIGGSDIIKYGASTTLNKREYMEDYIHHRLNKDDNDKQVADFAVYDGHGGHETAEYLQNNFHKLVDEALRKEQSEAKANLGMPIIMEKVLASAVATADKHAVDKFTCGSTLTYVRMLESGETYLGWVGDSRIIVGNRKNGVKFVTQGHDLNEKERERIIKAGGEKHLLKRTYNGTKTWRFGFPIEGTPKIALSRSIGDYIFKNEKHCVGFIATPDYHHMKLELGDFIVVCSDGAFTMDVSEVVSSEEIVQQVNDGLKSSLSLDKIAQLIQNYAIGKGSKDNIAVIVTTFGEEDTSVVKEEISYVSSMLSVTNNFLSSPYVLQTFCLLLFMAGWKYNSSK